MSHQPSTPRRHRWHPALHLLWSLPLAAVAALFLVFMSSLSWCGISGCSGGGFGRIRDPDVVAAVLYLVAAGVAVGLPVALVPWARTGWVRVLAAMVTAVLVCAVGYALIGP